MTEPEPRFRISEGLDGCERFPVGSLQFDPDNARRGNRPYVAGSLERFSQVLPVLIWSKPDGLQVVNGNTTLGAAIDLGATEIAGVLTPPGMTEVEVRALSIAINHSTDVSDWDYEILAGQLDEIRADDEILFGTIGFSDDDLLGMREIENIDLDDADLEPLDPETQPRLDQLRPVVCPNCQHEFHPR